MRFLCMNDDGILAHGLDCLVRAVQPLAHGFFASPRATLYSCGYGTQAERILALQRARRFCDMRGRRVVHFGSAVDRRAAWQ